jgi:uncharacterized protein (DUF433 family)
MSTQATFVTKAEVAGATIRRTERATYTGVPAAALELPSLGTPRVTYTQGPAGRRATVAGTGLDVWEIVATWRAVGENFRRLRAAYKWLSKEQLRAALEYYEQNREEIEARLAREQELTPEAVWERFPYTRPRS